ncbi:MAG: hypothetical protein K6F04_02100 [bacterium]|nr:hypothetical protein [bacterium]
MKKIANENYGLLEAVNDGWYKVKVDQVLEKLESNYMIDSIINDIQYLNKDYKKDGSYALEKVTEKVKARKYPKDVENQIIEEFKHAFLTEFYKKEEEKKKMKEDKQRNKHLEQKQQIIQYVDEHIFEWAYSDFENEDLEAIGNQIASAPIEIQKLIVDFGEFRYFTKPSDEIVIYALKTKETSLDWLKPEQRNKNIDLIAAELGLIYNIKGIKGLSKEAKLAFIENNPERIITKITAENFNTKELTIYDLNKKELEAYNKGMDTRNKKEEEKQIELVKKDPRAIYKIENPSTLVKNYAISAFRRQWER